MELPKPELPELVVPELPVPLLTPELPKPEPPLLPPEDEPPPASEIDSTCPPQAPVPAMKDAITKQKTGSTPDLRIALL